MAGLGPTFPLHRLVWANRHRELEAALHSSQVRPRWGSGWSPCRGVDSTPQPTCPCCASQPHPDFLGPALSEAQVTCSQA